MGHRMAWGDTHLVRGGDTRCINKPSSRWAQRTAPIKVIMYVYRCLLGDARVGGNKHTYMCMYTCICVHTRIHMYIGIYVYTRICMYIGIYVHIFTFIHTYLRV